MLLLFIPSNTNGISLSTKKTFMDQIIHSMENVFIPNNIEEWDTEKGIPEDHKQRMETNKNEMNALLVVGFIFNFLNLTPMLLLGMYAGVI